MHKVQFYLIRIVPILLLICFWSVPMEAERRDRQASTLNNAANAAMYRGCRDTALFYNARALGVDSTNPILWANRALYLLNGNPAFANPQIFTEESDIGVTEVSTVRESLRMFHKASILSPRDPVFIHNMGWLYWISGNVDSARSCFYRMIKQAPYNPMFLTSMGMFEEQIGHPTLAMTYYSKAIAISPELLNSPFFQELSCRTPHGASTVVAHAIDIVENEIEKQQSYGAKSRKACLSLYLGDSITAYRLLKDVTEHYPSFNRAWLMLGNLMENRNDSLALVYYKKAQVLDVGDPLPLFCLSKMYETIGNPQLASDYKRQALLRKENIRSGYVLRSKKIYQAQVWYNELYPTGLRAWLSSDAR